MVLPPWADDNPEKFIAIQREALESDYVSLHLHEWIDLIWGVNQRGEEAIAHNNLFFNITYVDDLDIQSVSDESLRANMLVQVAQYGQTPSQLFTSPHPARSAKPVAEFIPQHLYRLRHKAALQSILVQSKSILCVDSLGRYSLHSLNSAERDPTNFPVTILPSEKHTKRSVSGVTTSTRFSLVPSENEEVNAVISFGDLDALAHVAWLNGLASMKTESLSSHFDSISCISRDENVFAMGGRDGLISVWQSRVRSSTLRFSFSSSLDAKMELVQMLSGHRGEVACVAVDASLQIVAALDSTCCVTLHSYATGEALRAISLQPIVASLCKEKVKHLRPEGIQCALNGLVVVLLRFKQKHEVKQMFVVLRRNGSVMGSLVVPEVGVLGSFLLYHNQLRVIYCHQDGFVMRDLKDLKEVGRIDCKPPAPYSTVCFSEREQILLAGLENGDMIVFGLCVVCFTSK